MNIPLITWVSILLVSSVILVCKVMGVMRRSKSLDGLKGHRLVEIGHEWEELYIPGDRLLKGDYDYDEFDDL